MPQSAPGCCVTSVVIRNKRGWVFCAMLKQFAPLRAKSIKAWNQRRGRDAARRSHSSQGAPQDVTGQKTQHQGLPFLPSSLSLFHSTLQLLSSLINPFFLLDPLSFVAFALLSATHKFHELGSGLNFNIPSCSSPVVTCLGPKRENAFVNFSRLICFTFRSYLPACSKKWLPGIYLEFGVCRGLCWILTIHGDLFWRFNTGQNLCFHLRGSWHFVIFWWCSASMRVIKSKFTSVFHTLW